MWVCQGPVFSWLTCLETMEASGPKGLPVTEMDIIDTIGSCQALQDPWESPNFDPCFASTEFFVLSCFHPQREVDLTTHAVGGLALPDFVFLGCWKGGLHGRAD